MVKGRSHWKQMQIINKALLTDPDAPKFTVFTPPGLMLAESATAAAAAAANNNASSVSSMGIRFSRGGTRRHRSHSIRRNRRAKTLKRRHSRSRSRA